MRLKQAQVQSPAFEANARGDVALASDLMKSAIHVPVSISLSRQIAKQLNLLPANLATNALYAKLPDFFTMKGTLGNIQKDISKTALASLALKGIGSPVTGTVGNVLNNLGGLFGGGAGANSNPSQSGTNAPPPTNTPPKNQNPVNNLLNNLFGPKK